MKINIHSGIVRPAIFKDYYYYVEDYHKMITSVKINMKRHKNYSVYYTMNDLVKLMNEPQLMKNANSTVITSITKQLYDINMKSIDKYIVSDTSINLETVNKIRSRVISDAAMKLRQKIYMGSISINDIDKIDATYSLINVFLTKTNAQLIICKSEGLYYIDCNGFVNICLEKLKIVAPINRVYFNHLISNIKTQVNLQ